VVTGGILTIVLTSIFFSLFFNRSPASGRVLESTLGALASLTAACRSANYFVTSLP